MSKEHIRAFQAIAGVQIAGIHSRTRVRSEALAAEFGVPLVCDTVAELYEKTMADLVVVSVPELSANQVCRACFEFPWMALIEKPVGYNLTDAEEIAASARAKVRRAYVALNRRHYGSIRVVLEDLAGQPGARLVKIQDQEDPATALAAGQPQLVVDNWMYANAIHVIDMFFLFGRGKVTGIDNIVQWNSREPRYVVSKISFDSGDVGLYEAVWNGPGPWAVAVNTPTKRWEMRPLESAAFQLAGKRVLVPVERAVWDNEFKPGLRLQAGLAVQAALGGAAPGLPTLEDGLATMRLVKAIYG
jgi:predicted dehydrogenase